VSAADAVPAPFLAPLDVTIWAAIIAAGVSIVLFIAKMIIEISAEHLRRKANERARLLAPLFWELTSVERILSTETDKTALGIIKEYVPASNIRKAGFPSGKFLIDSLERIQTIIEKDVSCLCGPRRKKLLKELIGWQLQLSIITRYCAEPFDDGYLDSDCKRIDAKEFMRLRTSISSRGRLE